MKHIKLIQENEAEIRRIIHESVESEEASTFYESLREDADNMLEFFSNSSFFTDPASAKYHNAFDGGLADHCLKVYKQMVKLNEMNDLNIHNYVLVRVAFLHDLCKVGNYDRGIRWRKDKNNKWESYYGYTYNDMGLTLGHGAESLHIAQQLCKLEKEETAAIYWHMGVGTTYNIYDYFNQARQSSLVAITHTADALSCALDEKYGEDETLVFKDIKKLVYGA